MKAIVVREFGSPDVMKVENAPEPVPGPGQVTIRVHAAGVNPVDTYIRAGPTRASPTCRTTRHRRRRHRSTRSAPASRE